MLDAVGSAQPFLFGSLDGGCSSLLFAATYPERTAGLALYGTLARLTNTDGYRIGLEPDFVEALAEASEELVGTSNFVSVVAPSKVDDDRFCDWYSRYNRAACSPGIFAGWLRQLGDLDIRPLLSSVTAPTVVMHRRGDRLIPPALGRFVADHIDGAHYVDLSGDDYLFYVGDTDSIADEIEELVTGWRGHIRSDRTLATVLFTDIVESTRTARDVGDDKWREMLETHDEACRVVIEHHGGRVVKTLDDGLLALFSDPEQAIRAALTIRRRLALQGLQIRCDLHAGAVELSENDVSGIAVHLASRVLGRAESGQVLVSRTIVDLVAGTVIKFEDCGQHVLKGVEGSWKLFAVVDA